MISTKFLAISEFAILLATPALAQSNQGMQGMQGMQDMPDMGKHGSRMDHMNMTGMHMMPATVTGVDMNTGIVEATSEGMKLRLHFPPASLATVKAGDKITLHLGFTKQ